MNILKTIGKTLLSIKWKHYINYIAVGAFTIYLAYMTFNGNMPGSETSLYTDIGVAIILAVSLSMVVGFLGELSLGHAGFMCVGAYVGGKLAMMFTERFSNLDEYVIFVIALVVGGLAAMLCGFIIGLPALRLRGDYLAIVTLAFGEIVRTLFMYSGGFFGDQSGMKTPRLDSQMLPLISFILVLVTLFVTQNIIRSKHGRAITAIRDSEIAAKATGINVTKYKLMVFAIAALFAGIAGVISSYTENKIQAATYDYNYSIEILVIVVLGGMGSINGSIIAATLITFLNKFLQTDLVQILNENFPGENEFVNMIKDALPIFRNIIYALILILLVIYNNAPALKNFREKYNIKNLFSKIFSKKHNPAKNRDDEAKWDRVPTKIEIDEVLSVDIQPGSPYTPDKSDKSESDQSVKEEQ